MKSPWTAGCGGGLFGGLLTGALLGDDLSAAGVTAAATLVLAIITAYYAVEAARNRRQQRELWDADRAERQRNESTAAVRRALDAINESGVSMTAGETDDFRGLYAEIERLLFEITDGQVHERLAICAETARVASHPAHFDHADTARPVPGFALLLARGVVTRTRWTVEAFIAGRPLPSWDELPPRKVQTYAWLVDSARAGRNVITEVLTDMLPPEHYGGTDARLPTDPGWSHRPTT